jgi:hypothetical protein
LTARGILKLPTEGEAVSEQEKLEAFKDGVRYALEYLKDEVFGEEVTETDIWKDHFGEKDADNE